MSFLVYDLLQQHYTSRILRKKQEQFLMARGVRQGCPASVFFFFFCNGLRSLSMAPGYRHP